MQHRTGTHPKSGKAPLFEITVLKLASEDTERLKFLRNQAEQSKETYQALLRDIIEECINLKIDKLEQCKTSLFCEMLHSLAQAISTQCSVPTHPSLKVINLIQMDRHLFNYCYALDPTTVCNNYQNYHSLVLEATKSVFQCTL